MHLEKASSASQEAGVVGWISSNDVTLFTVVLVLVIAIFLQVTLERRAGENASLSSQNESLALENVQSDKRIAHLTADLQRAQAEAARLAAARDALNAESVALKQRLQSTAERLATMDRDLRSLTDAQTALAQSKQAELAAAGEQLALRDRELDELRQERSLLEEFIASLRQRLESLEGDLDMTGQRLTAAEQEKTQLGETATLLRKALAQSEEKLAATAKEVDAAGENQRLLNLQIAALQTQLKNALDRAAQAEASLQAQPADNQHLHRKLVGVKGPLKRVAVLVDASGSMAEAPGRWENVREIVTTWLEHLDVEQCVLILYAAEATAFPSDGSLLTVRGAAGKENRARLTERLASHEPGGWTNTLAALEIAYARKDIDTIILFTDGRPASAAAAFDRAAVERIHALSARHRHIPINTIGVGDYFADPGFSLFLRKLADTTGGTFLGR